MRMRLRILGGLVLAFVLGAAGVTRGQGRFGGLAGTVRDAEQAAVPGATVTVVNTTTGASRVVVSGGDGSFRIPDIEPGRYTVTVDCRGSRRSNWTTSSSCSAAPWRFQRS